MSFNVDIEISREFEVQCPYDRVFDVLSDVPESASHFPKVEALVDLGGNAYRWEMEKIGIDRIHIQTIYACKYTDNREKGWVKWTPVKGVGNGTLKGKWTIKALDEDTTHVELATEGQLEVPGPGLIKMLISPLVVAAFERLVDQYVDNLTETFEKKTKKKKTPRKKSS